MITIQEIKLKALRRFEDYLRSIVLGDLSFFPLNIPGNKEIERSKGIGIIQEQLIKLYKSDKANIGYGYVITSKTVNTKFGSIPVINKIEFVSEIDYLKFIEKEKECNGFKLLLAATLSEFPNLKPLLTENPGILFDNLVIWNDLMEVCRYFVKNPLPMKYIRELPIPVHTKFIESNTGVLTILLSVLIASSLNRAGTTFESKFNLKTKHNLIRIRFLDMSLSPLANFEEIGIAETEVNALSIKCKCVFIIENDIAALTFPGINDSIVIFGKGYSIASLKRINWLTNVEIYYWSDIDVQGFEMLSQIRGYFPQVKSFLMDELTYNTFKSDVGKGSQSTKNLPANLYPQEAALYNYLKEENFRLEQEKIPQSWVAKWVPR